MPNDGHRLELAHSVANDAVRAVAMQHYRIHVRLPEDERFFEGRSFRQEMDLHFLLLALRRLRRAAQTASEITKDNELGQALANFDAALPEAKKMRDLGEHIDDYIQGRGRLQARISSGSLGVRVWGESADGGLTLDWAGLKTSTDEVLRAADALYEGIGRALRR